MGTDYLIIRLCTIEAMGAERALTGNCLKSVIRLLRLIPRCAYIDAAAVLCDDQSVTIFCVNRDMNEDYSLEADLRSFVDLIFC
jgi:hypothetical protein